MQRACWLAAAAAVVPVVSLVPGTEAERLQLCAARPGSSACYGAGGAMEAEAAAVEAERAAAGATEGVGVSGAAKQEEQTIMTMMAEVEELKRRLHQTPELRLPLSISV